LLEAARNRLWEFFSLPNCALEVLIHAWWHGLVVFISNVLAYHFRIEEAVTANAAMPLVACEDVRTPLGTFRIVPSLVSIVHRQLLARNSSEPELVYPREDLVVNIVCRSVRPRSHFPARRARRFD
jgi:hypothetical protein